MGQTKSKSDTVVVNEQLNLNPTALNAVRASEDTATTNIVIICSIVTIFWVLLLKALKHYFKKQVQAYSVNV
jgi:hypothetical protein